MSKNLLAKIRSLEGYLYNYSVLCSKHNKAVNSAVIEKELDQLIEIIRKESITFNR